ncbi:MAG: LptF/LptG family permease [Pseudomonadota bacterium]|nr:LptF/LptG family permease [Pseudomonadota bacterium]
MKLLKRYNYKNIIMPTFMALFVMLSMTWLIQSLRFLDFMINRGLEMKTFLYITVLIMPQFLVIVLPLSVFAGASYNFRRMNDERESLICLCSGLSRLKLVGPAIKLAGFIVIIGYILSLFLQPLGQRTFKDLQHLIRSTGGNLLIREGTFNQLNSDLMVYVKARPAPTRLEGILVQDNSNEGAPITWMAQSGEVSFDSEGRPRLRLQYGSRQEINDKQLSTLSFDSHTIDIVKQFTPKGPRYRKPDERYLPELLNLESANSEKDRNKFIAEAHKRLLWPLTPIPMVLIAAACLLKNMHNRQATLLGPGMIATLFSVLYIGLLIATNTLASGGNQAALYGQWALPFVFTYFALRSLREKSLKGKTLKP